MSFAVKVDDNLAEGVIYSTVFRASDKTTDLRWPSSTNRSFQIFIPEVLQFADGHINSAVVGGTPGECRVDWIMDSIPGVNNPFVDTPEVSEATSRIAEKLKSVNYGKIDFAPLETETLTPVNSPKGFDDVVAQKTSEVVKTGKDLLSGVTDPLKNAFSGFTTAGVILIVVVGIGLAIGLSRSRVSASV